MTEKKNLTAKETFALAVQNQQKNNLQVAEDFYKEVLKKNSEHLPSYNNLGNVLLKLGKKQEAINCFLKVIEIKPESEHGYFNLGNTLELMSQHQEAVSHYRKTIEINPNFVKAYIRLGRILNKLGKNNEAIQYIKKAISIKPNYPEAHNNLGNLLKHLGKQDEAINSYKKAIQIDPNFFLAHHNLGNILSKLGKYQKAISYYEKAIEINPNHADAYYNLGNALSELGEYQKAISYYEKTIQINPNYAGAYNNNGVALKKLGEFQKAISCYQKAIQINPHQAGTHNNLGLVFKALGEYQKAISYYEKAIQISPNYTESKLNQSLCRLALGEFEIGWKKFEYRFDVEDRIAFRRYKIDKLWDGNYLDSTLLVWGEQGIGDHILFASMLTDLRKYAKNIILEIDKRLVNLLKRYYEKINFSNIKVINLEKKLVNNFDKHIAIGSLGQYLRKTKKSFETTPKKYFIPSPAKEKELRNKFFTNKKFKVGISWKSLNKKHQYRNIDLTQMLPILSNPHCDFINLQFGKFDEDLQQLQSKHGIKIRTIKEIDNYNNIEDLAALINCLDLVINVQNTNADLAAALGQNTWAMVAKNHEWRWSANEKKSLWYPTTKIFKQEKVGNWNSVINNINMDLKKLIK